jgi:hypothetical protein
VNPGKRVRSSSVTPCVSGRVAIASDCRSDPPGYGGSSPSWRTYMHALARLIPVKAYIPTILPRVRPTSAGGATHTVRDGMRFCVTCAWLCIKGERCPCCKENILSPQ